jgi:hypothetical protein
MKESTAKELGLIGEIIIKWTLKEISEGINWINFSKSKVHQRAVMKTGIWLAS